MRRLALILCLLSPAAWADAVTVFAAASLKAPLDAALAGTGAVASYAGTPVIARQVVAGAPADIVLTADAAWMDVIAEAGVPLRDRRSFLGNALVIAGPPGTPPSDPAQALAKGRVATASTNAVPLGRAARAALGAMGLWEATRPRLIGAQNAAAATRLLALGEVDRAVLYATDAAGAGLAVVAPVPPETHPPIRYEAARLTDGVAARTVFAAILASDAFVAAGFARVD
ncbi:MAG: molybdate ABC transporter substrate-binding protein [Shimia sp.]